MAPKKVARKAATSKRASHAAPAAPAAPAVPKQVVLLINGQSSGMRTPVDGDTVGSVANQIARDNGLKSYSILVNGTKVTTEQASNSLKGVTSIEVFAKETRG